MVRGRGGEFGARGVDGDGDERERGAERERERRRRARRTFRASRFVGGALGAHGGGGRAREARRRDARRRPARRVVGRLVRVRRRPRGDARRRRVRARDARRAARVVDSQRRRRARGEEEDGREPQNRQGYEFVDETGTVAPRRAPSAERREL